MSDIVVVMRIEVRSSTFIYLRDFMEEVQRGLEKCWEFEEYLIEEIEKDYPELIKSREDMILSDRYILFKDGKEEKKLE